VLLGRHRAERRSGDLAALHVARDLHRAAARDEPIGVAAKARDRRAVDTERGQPKGRVVAAINPAANVTLPAPDYDVGQGSIRTEAQCASAAISDGAQSASCGVVRVAARAERRCHRLQLTVGTVPVFDEAPVWQEQPFELTVGRVLVDRAARRALPERRWRIRCERVRGRIAHRVRGLLRRGDRDYVAIGVVADTDDRAVGSPPLHNTTQRVAAVTRITSAIRDTL
jgi:hypothetical protein